MKLYKALATAMVATAATMAAMPAGNAAVFTTGVTITRQAVFTIPTVNGTCLTCVI